MLITLAIVTALYSPAQPTVGDHVTITFEQPVALDPAPEYEVVSRSGNQVVIRTFSPKPLVLGGVVNGASGPVRFRNLVLPMKSVLRPNDDFKPAPLVAPRELPATHLARNLIVAAALLALAAWALVWLKRDRSVRKAAKPSLPPPEAFRVAVARAAQARQPWAALADATREYLGAHGIGRELTTSQVVTRLPGTLSDRVDRGWLSLIVDVLRRGDLEKFSPWGPPPGDFDGLARGALGLVEVLDPPVPEKPAEQVAA